MEEVGSFEETFFLVLLSLGLMVCCCMPLQKGFAVYMQRDIGAKFIEVREQEAAAVLIFYVTSY